MRNITPLDDRMVVVPIPVEKEGRLYIPDAHAPRPATGTVVKVGRGARSPDGTILPLECQVGDVVTYPGHAGFPVHDDDRGCGVLVMHEHEVVARSPRCEHLRYTTETGDEYVCDICGATRGRDVEAPWKPAAETVLMDPNVRNFRP